MCKGVELGIMDPHGQERYRYNMLIATRVSIGKEELVANKWSIHVLLNEVAVAFSSVLDRDRASGSEPG